MSSFHRTVSVPSLRLVLDHAVQQGLSAERVRQEACLPPEAFEDVDGRAALSSFDALVMAVISLSGDRHLGLRVGSTAPTDQMGCIHYLVASSDTLGQCLERLCAYSRLVGDGARPELEREGSNAWLRMTIYDTDLRSPEVVCYTADTWLSAVMRLMRIAVADGFQVEQLLLPPQCQRDDADYLALFGARPAMALDRCGIQFTASVLDHVMPNPDPSLSRVMQKHADQLLQELPPVDDLRGSVGRAIERELADGTVTLERTAHRLGMSSRSLQRRLKEEGLSFREVVDEVRRGRAREYLKDRSISVDETAFLLGFSNASAFGRACRRWTQLSPREYRTRLLAEAGTA